MRQYDGQLTEIRSGRLRAVYYGKPHHSAQKEKRFRIIQERLKVLDEILAIKSQIAQREIERQR